MATPLVLILVIYRYPRGVTRTTRPVRPVRRQGESADRPAIINPDDLKELDQLDIETEDGWAGESILHAICFKTDSLKNGVSSII